MESHQPELPLVGDEFAGYRLRSIIGRGGMSVVFQAENPRLGNVIALKVLAPELATDDVFRARFLEESRIAAAMNHPNVIPIHDTGSSDGLLFIAMRYVAGTDLRQMVKKRGRLQPRNAIFLLSQAARALDAAHRRGLVHRDVKPGNLLVEQSNDDTDPDHLYLADFGITKMTSGRTGLTSTGQFVGTVDYVAPEQIRGISVLGLADQYSLGCVLYECLTGRVPFEKDLDAAIIWAHVEEQPTRPTHLRPDLPPEVDDMFARVLAKDPGDRYETCREFMTAARDALGPMAADDAPDRSLPFPRRPPPLPLPLPGRPAPDRPFPERPVADRPFPEPPLGDRPFPERSPGGRDPGPVPPVTVDPAPAPASIPREDPASLRWPAPPPMEELPFATALSDPETTETDQASYPPGAAQPEWAVPYLPEDPDFDDRPPWRAGSSESSDSSGAFGGGGSGFDFGRSRHRRDGRRISLLLLAIACVLALGIGVTIGAWTGRGSGQQPKADGVTGLPTGSPSASASAPAGVAAMTAPTLPATSVKTLKQALNAVNITYWTTGYLPPDTCTYVSADYAKCGHPFSGITEAVFQDYSTPAALYQAYEAAIKQANQGHLVINTQDCGESAPPASGGEISWNHFGLHTPAYSIAQLETGKLNAASQAAGRVFCNYDNSTNTEDVIWTQTDGNLLAEATGSPHLQVWTWWLHVHHNIAFNGQPMGGMDATGPVSLPKG